MNDEQNHVATIHKQSTNKEAPALIRTSGAISNKTNITTTIHNNYIIYRIKNTFFENWTRNDTIP